MAAYLKKSVRWDVDGSFSELSSFGSPSSDRSSDLAVSTSSVEFVNSQLIAHGFTTKPGLALEGLSSTELDRVVRCLMGMLSQRMEDMSKTEDLSSKLRTANYDYERIRSMYTAASDRALNAEKEASLHKSRLATATRALQQAEAAHRQTSNELQRTKNALAGVRATHQTELRKKEKDIEKLTERWLRVADSQSKLASTASGLYITNSNVVDGTEFIKRGDNYLELALEQAEQAREGLQVEVLDLRKTAVRMHNELQILLQEGRTLLIGEEEEPLPPATVDNMFPLHPKSQARDKILILLEQIQSIMQQLHDARVEPEIERDELEDQEKVDELRRTITTLQGELDQTKQALTRSQASRESFNRYTKVDDSGCDDLESLRREAELERLEAIKTELREDRTQLTEASLKLDKERAQIEHQRAKLLADRRKFEASQFADVPPLPDEDEDIDSQPAEVDYDDTPPAPKPVHTATAPFPPISKPHKRSSPRHSNGRSPIRAIAVGKAGRRPITSARLSLTSRNIAMPAYETEVIPSSTAASTSLDEDTSAPTPMPFFGLKPMALGASLLTSSFELPPPSPGTSFPSSPALAPTSRGGMAPLPSLMSALDAGAGGGRIESYSDSSDSSAPAPPPDTRTRKDKSKARDKDKKKHRRHAPTTPSRPFPMAKPFVRGMTHAYSPTKPSPLKKMIKADVSSSTITSSPSSSKTVSPPHPPPRSNIFGTGPRHQVEVLAADEAGREPGDEEGDYEDVEDEGYYHTHAGGGGGERASGSIYPALTASLAPSIPSFSKHQFPYRKPPRGAALVDNYYEERPQDDEDQLGRGEDGDDNDDDAEEPYNESLSSRMSATELGVEPLPPVGPQPPMRIPSSNPVAGQRIPQKLGGAAAAAARGAGGATEKAAIGGKQPVAAVAKNGVGAGALTSKGRRILPGSTVQATALPVVKKVGPVAAASKRPTTATTTTTTATATATATAATTTTATTTPATATGSGPRPPSRNANSNSTNAGSGGSGGAAGGKMLPKRIFR